MGKFRPSNIWTRGVYYEGLMALHTVYPRSDYYDYAYDWADFHKWGLRGGNITRNADDHCCGQAYIELYKISPDPAKIKNIKVSIDMLVNTPQVDSYIKSLGIKDMNFTETEESMHTDIMLCYNNWRDRKSTRLNSSHPLSSRMPSSA